MKSTITATVKRIDSEIINFIIRYSCQRRLDFIFDSYPSQPKEIQKRNQPRSIESDLKPNLKLFQDGEFDGDTWDLITVLRKNIERHQLTVNILPK